MGGRKESPLDRQNKLILSANLKRLASSRNLKQVDISKATKISLSTLNGYFQGHRLPTPGNVQKLADFFNVNKSDIDPRFKNIGYQPKDDDSSIRHYVSNLRSFNGKPITEAERKAIEAMTISFLRSQHSSPEKNNKN